MIQSKMIHVEDDSWMICEYAKEFAMRFTDGKMFKHNIMFSRAGIHIELLGGDMVIIDYADYKEWQHSLPED